MNLERDIPFRSNAVRAFIAQRVRRYERGEEQGNFWGTYDTRPAPDRFFHERSYEQAFLRFFPRFQTRDALANAFGSNDGIDLTGWGMGFIPTFRTRCLDRKIHGKSCHVIDLFGQGSPVLQGYGENLSDWHVMDPIDSVVGICLTDPRSRKNYPQNPKQDIIVGNIFDSSLWYKKIPEYMKKLGIHQGFDLLLCRPDAALGDISIDLKRNGSNIEIFYYLMYEILRRSYRLMSFDESEMFIQPSGNFSIINEKYRSIFVQVLKKAGVTLKTDDDHPERGFNSSFVIEKRKNSPSSLPRYKEFRHNLTFF